MKSRLKKIGLANKIIHCKNIQEADKLFNIYKNLNSKIEDNNILSTIRKDFTPIEFLQDGIFVDIDYDQWFSLEEIKESKYENITISFEEWYNLYYRNIK